MTHFAAMVAELGGPPDMAEDWHYPSAQGPGRGRCGGTPRRASISAIDGEALGLAVVAMGGGRRVETDRIDPAVGLTDVAPVGTRVNRGDPIAVIHARSEASAEATARAVQAAMTIGATGETRPLIRERIG